MGTIIWSVKYTKMYFLGGSEIYFISFYNKWPWAKFHAFTPNSTRFARFDWTKIERRRKKRRKKEVYSIYELTSIRDWLSFDFLSGVIGLDDFIVYFFSVKCL